MHIDISLDLPGAAVASLLLQLSLTLFSHSVLFNGTELSSLKVNREESDSVLFLYSQRQFVCKFTISTTRNFAAMDDE